MPSQRPVPEKGWNREEGLFQAALCDGMVNDNYRNDIKEINKGHKEEMAAMTEAINNNTMVIQKLIERMGKDEC